MFCWEWGAVGEDDGGVDLAFCDNFLELAVFFFGRSCDDRASRAFGFNDCGDVGFFAL